MTAWQQRMKVDFLLKVFPFFKEMTKTQEMGECFAHFLLGFATGLLSNVGGMTRQKFVETCGKRWDRTVGHEETTN